MFLMKIYISISDEDGLIMAETIKYRATPDTTVGELACFITETLTKEGIPSDIHPIAYCNDNEDEDADADDYKYFLIEEDSDKTLQALGIKNKITSIHSVDELIQIGLFTTPTQDDRLIKKLSLQEHYAFDTIISPSFTDTQITILARVLRGNTAIKSLVLGHFDNFCTTSALHELLTTIKDYTHIQALAISTNLIPTQLFQDVGSVIAEFLAENTRLKELNLPSSRGKKDIQHIATILADHNSTLLELNIGSSEKLLTLEELQAIDRCLDTNHSLIKLRYKKEFRSLTIRTTGEHIGGFNFKKESIPDNPFEPSIKRKLKRNEAFLKTLEQALTSLLLINFPPVLSNIISSYLQSQYTTFKVHDSYSLNVNHQQKLVYFLSKKFDPTLSNIISSYLQNQYTIFDIDSRSLLKEPLKAVEEVSCPKKPSSKKRKTQPTETDSTRTYNKKQNKKKKPSSKALSSTHLTPSKLDILKQLAPAIDWQLTNDAPYAYYASERLAKAVAELNHFFADHFSPIRAKSQTTGEAPAFILENTNVENLELLNTSQAQTTFRHILTTSQPSSSLDRRQLSQLTSSSFFSPASSVPSNIVDMLKTVKFYSSTDSMVHIVSHDESYLATLSTWMQAQLKVKTLSVLKAHEETHPDYPDAYYLCLDTSQYTAIRKQLSTIPGFDCPDAVPPLGEKAKVKMEDTRTSISMLID